jgi:hypothetical protein
MSPSVKRTTPQGISEFARRGKAVAAGEDALRHVAGACARAGFLDANLVLRWADIAGPEVARIARPMKWHAGESGAVLTVMCDPGAIVFLQHETRGLIERLNRYLGNDRIARLKLVPGRLDGGPKSLPHPARLLGFSSNSKPKLSLPQALERLGQLRGKARI